jgi:hypothetical protein
MWKEIWSHILWHCPVVAVEGVTKAATTLRRVDLGSCMGNRELKKRTKPWYFGGPWC